MIRFPPLEGFADLVPFRLFEQIVRRRGSAKPASLGRKGLHCLLEPAKRSIKPTTCDLFRMGHHQSRAACKNAPQRSEEAACT